MAKLPIIRAFFDEPTNTVSYLVADPATKKAVIIDPVLDYDHDAGTVDTRSVEAILKAADEAAGMRSGTLISSTSVSPVWGAALPRLRRRRARIGVARWTER